MWLLPLAIAVFGAVFFMNNLTTARSTFKDQLAIVGRKHTWIMSFIYIGTFGSFIGYSAAFPLLIKTQFPAISVGIAFLGPLVGSLSRPLGGLLADKVGGAIVTFWNFIAMGAATIGVIYFVDAKEFSGFLAMFLVLFITTGIGNGSTYRMIPSIFREEKLRQAKGAGEAGRALALSAAGIESGAALGFIGAIGACGGYLIPRGFGASIAVTGGPQLALEFYLAFYAVCLALTWWFYLRKTFLRAARRQASRKRACEAARASATANDLTRGPGKEESSHDTRPSESIQESFSKVAPISEQAAELFYGRLFEIAPAVKPLFHGDMKEQGRKLMATLAVVVNGLGQSGKRCCRRRARSPSVTSAMASRRAITLPSAPRCCGRWKRAWARIGRRASPRPGAPPTPRCPEFMIGEAYGRSAAAPNRRRPMSEPLVIIGNGMAAARLCEELATARARPLCHRA